MPKFTVKIRAVGDTGPLLSAFQCERIDILRHFHEVIYITPDQMAELQEHGAGEAAEALVREGFLVVVSLSEDEEREALKVAEMIAKLARNKNPKAHLPEAKAMVLMIRRKLGATAFLVEERAAFSVAQSLGLNPVGFVGVLLRAAEVSLMKPEEVLAALKECRSKGTFYSDELLREVERRLKKEGDADG